MKSSSRTEEWPLEEFGRAGVGAHLREAVRAWAVARFDSEDVRVGVVDVDEEEDRYLVDFAVRSLGHWCIAEVWIEDGEVTSINDLGEGFPADGAPWPWAEQSSRFEGGRSDE